MPKETAMARKYSKGAQRKVKKVPKRRALEVPIECQQYRQVVV
jgi:hypothetical protein